MKIRLLIFLYILITNVFALTYQNVITEQIKSIFQLTKVVALPSKFGIPATVGGGTYTTGDNKLGFASSCFKNDSNAKKFVNQFVSMYKLYPEPDIQKNLYGATYKTGIILVKQAKNCVVTIMYFGDPNMKNTDKLSYIRGELNLLSGY